MVTKKTSRLLFLKNSQPNPHARETHFKITNFALLHNHVILHISVKLSRFYLKKKKSNNCFYLKILWQCLNVAKFPKELFIDIFLVRGRLSIKRVIVLIFKRKEVFRQIEVAA